MNTTHQREYRRLKRAGFDVNSTPTFETNHGSESVTHAVCKLLTARYVQDHGWQADCEVTFPGNAGTVDVLCYAPDRLNIVVELETNPTEQVKQSKLCRYVGNQNLVDDMILVDITDAPDSLAELEVFLYERLDLW